MTTTTDQTTSTTLPAPTWATSEGDLSGDTVKWNHKVELNAMEVDGADSMTVEAYLYDYILVADGHAVSLERGVPEIQVTRHDVGDPDFCGGALRFEIANARKFAATIVACCDAVEGVTTS